ncbi:peptide-methionine (S)-S-oxide reductase [Paeniglutamicibacter sulfureus]|uniref:Peptide methionine sulfoxide reductase MsrA n=1 Tax=Paeniglutamicibacter sulfureus TaxID=43666 RepID=A0ABU2BCR5_9MICC|nr:peptide-methionine (S)-S-oxide reductase [Paeniglutamicibacter sulfureus]
MSVDVNDFSISSTPIRFSPTTRGPAGQELTTFVLAGGCFWCLDAVYQRTRGVHAVVSGYTGGSDPAPNYRSVCGGNTGHAEAVAVTFDPAVVPDEVILDMFFTTHDPTTLNRQGYDVGTQYRSAMYPLDAAQESIFRESALKFGELYPDPLVTAFEVPGDFFVAEGIHQDYYNRFPEEGYCRVIIDPKLAKARKYYATWLEEPAAERS